MLPVQSTISDTERPSMDARISSHFEALFELRTWKSLVSVFLVHCSLFVVLVIMGNVTQVYTVWKKICMEKNAYENNR